MRKKADIISTTQGIEPPLKQQITYFSDENLVKSISRKNCAEILKQGREFLEQVLSVYEFALIDYKSWLTTQSHDGHTIHL